MSTAIFFASSTGNSEEVANIISEKLDGLRVYDISSISIDELQSYEKLIIGTSTWGEGELQDDLDEMWEDFCEIDFSGKTVALFGLGDQDNYSDEFCNALGTVYEQVTSKGANVIGFTSTEGYEFDDSTAVKNDEFVGLVIDEDNQEDLTHERIESWVESIKSDIL